MSLVEDTNGISTPAFETKMPEFHISEAEGESGESESFKDHVKGFAKAWGEMVVGLGKGCKDIVVQNYLTEDSYLVQKLRGPVNKVSDRLRYLNEFLPEDRDPFHAWLVIILVFLLAFAGNFNLVVSLGCSCIWGLCTGIIF